ncbi:MAG: DUF4190 domain-containing protein [Leptolyngbya sp. PLA3]|nr:MAG: DUF4190 domain-containing protein [Cyanobacteria bacterium CYA]MCE7967686.1 DUF4190 domain-containing protein [Leptolyngbya sp. PL-A3]
MKLAGASWNAPASLPLGHPAAFSIRSACSADAFGPNRPGTGRLACAGEEPCPRGVRLAESARVVYAPGMSQYSNPSYGYETEMMSEPPRTSALAVVSLVLSLVGCCLPIGLLGVISGVFSLVGIARSQGRVSGKGLAIAGIIIGVINTAIWVGGGLAITNGYKAYVGMTSTTLTALETGDYQAVRNNLDPSLTVSDEQLAAFAEAYRADLGSFRGMAPNVFEFVGDFADPTVGPKMQNYQGRQNMMPIAARFAQGKTVVLFLFDPRAQGGGAPVFNDLVIVLTNGDELKLSDFAAAPPGAPPAEAPAAPEDVPGGGDTQPDSDG